MTSFKFSRPLVITFSQAGPVDAWVANLTYPQNCSSSRKAARRSSKQVSGKPGRFTVLFF
jgi:hypothetical protein